MPWNTALLEKLIVTQLVHKFPTFYGSQNTGSGAHEASYPMGTGDSVPGSGRGVKLATHLH